MRTADFDYLLPEELIAQEAVERGDSRMLIVDRKSGQTHHQGISDLTSWLKSGDLLLLNDTRVIAARLEARRPTGRRFEVFLLEDENGVRWRGLVKPTSRARQGENLELSDGGSLRLDRALGEGLWDLTFDPVMDVERLDRIGATPLPPYIHRPGGPSPEDRERYQTVYATEPGAVAAPTAGLHFNQTQLDVVEAAGVEIARLTLHVGIGTFRPVSVEQVADHQMHSERYCFTEETAAAVNLAIGQGRRIVCVGTTSARALEGALVKGAGQVQPGWDSTDIFITPGYHFRGVGALLTNFHLPKSTLLMMVSALGGRERMLDVYAEAVRERYRFFSFGDAMLIV
ncbi:MAG: tRNA preQ1(34) S-adenosylmethionine ribosyltransferase-isomerase QueA [Acidobacteria bacterium]|nr:MAG: tRNA preQ1(34) S-adenosylmethionine ribosyltransferase-isomerase QueA [Acidobacteriota bacterium]